MMLADVRGQMVEIFNRAMLTGASVKQSFPKQGEDRGYDTLGDLKSTSIALKNIPYADIYNDLNENEQFHMKLPDGGLLLFQYKFKPGGGQLVKHRLAYFPCPILPTVDEAPELYKRDSLYADIVLSRIVRFPIRFDYDPDNYKVQVHPHSHVTLGQFENCRIPVASPVSPNSFLLFVLRNFYFLLYQCNRNMFEKRMAGCGAVRCITPAETAIAHLVI